MTIDLRVHHYKPDPDAEPPFCHTCGRALPFLTVRVIRLPQSIYGRDDKHYCPLPRTCGEDATKHITGSMVSGPTIHAAQEAMDA